MTDKVYTYVSVCTFDQGRLTFTSSKQSQLSYLSIYCCSLTFVTLTGIFCALSQL